MTRWIRNLLVLAALGVGLLTMAILGLWSFMIATATPLHPNPQEVPSVTRFDPPSEWADAVERGRHLARAGLTEQSLPGLSVAVGVAGDIVWAEGFGWAELTFKEPVAPEMLFRVGTASMALTSAAVGLLMEDGRLELDDEIQTYVPEFPEKQWPVTLRQLMGHVAGVRNDAGDEGPLGEHCEETVEGLQLFADRPLLFEPGTRYRFSSFGWVLMSAAVEAAADEPFLRFMRERVFDPLGMNDTRPDSADEQIPNRVTSYFPRFAAEPKYGLHPTRRIDYSCYAGASVFLSTPSDLVRFGMAINGGKLLRPETVALLQTPQRTASGDETGYGLGWDLEDVTLAGEPTRWVGHDGTSMGGMVASLITFPERGIVVAVTSNIAYADVESIGLGLAQAFAERRSGQARE